VAPRAYWKGSLKLSLVSCPISLFPATSEREKVSFHQINKNTGHRIKYRKVDSETGDEVEPGEIVKGYEVSKLLILKLAIFMSCLRWRQPWTASLPEARRRARALARRAERQKRYFNPSRPRPGSLRAGRRKSSPATALSMLTSTPSTIQE